MKIIEKWRLWFLVSGLVFAVGLAVMLGRAYHQEPVLNYGVDFTGGTQFILKVDSLLPSDSGAGVDHGEFLGGLRASLDAFPLEKAQLRVTEHGELMIRTIQLDMETRQSLLAYLSGELGEMELLEVSVVGPSIGEELREQSLWIIGLVSIGLMIYISLRFEWVYGAAALAAVIHDAALVLGISALMNIEVNTAFVAAILTILGYSINDTIVIFDRIRENLKDVDRETEGLASINSSIQQTLMRSLHTSITTLTVIAALLFFGGSTIQSFTQVLFIGVIVGTYSSICIASPVLVKLGVLESPVQEEGA